MTQKFLLSALLFFSVFIGFAQPIYTVKNGLASFFSAAPLENIEAKNTSIKGILNTSTKEVHLIIPIRQYKFEKALMEEHFNENYLESEKFPNATYDGVINESIDFTKDGVYEVTSTGKLNIHGVDQQRTEKGKLTIKGDEISLETEMKVKLADFKIEIPKLVFQNIAEVVDVKFSATLKPYKKPEKK